MKRNTFKTVTGRIIPLFMALLFITTPAFAATEEYNPMFTCKSAIDSWRNKKEILHTKYEGKVSDEVFNPKAEFTLENTQVVKKEKGKDFVILNLTDIHFSDYDYRFFYGFNAEATARRLVKEVKPDLITVTGDAVCDSSTYMAIRRFTDLMESFGVPWAPVFGNHDDEGNCDLNYLCDVMMNAPHCLLKKGDPAMGYGNYVVTIVEENDGAPAICEALVMMDSHHSQPNEVQQNWLKWVGEGINRISSNNADISVWMHIPLPEYQYAKDEFYNTWKHSWAPECSGYGEIHEKICCERDADSNPVQRGFYEAAKSVGTIKNIICGHEHMNNFSVMYDGIRITYTLKLGFSSGFQPGFNGGTVITVTEKGLTHMTYKTAKFRSFKVIEDFDI